MVSGVQLLGASLLQVEIVTIVVEWTVIGTVIVGTCGLMLLQGKFVTSEAVVGVVKLERYVVVPFMDFGQCASVVIAVEIYWVVVVTTVCFEALGEVLLVKGTCDFVGTLREPMPPVESGMLVVSLAVVLVQGPCKLVGTLREPVAPVESVIVVASAEVVLAYGP